MESFNSSCGILPSRLLENEWRYLILFNPWSNIPWSPFPHLNCFPGKTENASPLRHLSFHGKEAMTALSPPFWKYSRYVWSTQRMMTAASCPKPDSLGLVYSWLVELLFDEIEQQQLWNTFYFFSRFVLETRTAISPLPPYSRLWVGIFTLFFPSFKS